MSQGKEVGLCAQPMRWYVDQAEWPFVGLAVALSFCYIGSFWLEVSYLTLMAPLVLILQVVAASLTAYLVGVRQPATWQQVGITCLLVGFGGGAISALWSLIRFLYGWLVLNLLAEPVWSGLLSGIVGVVTVIFFHLPGWLKALNEPQTSS